MLNPVKLVHILLYLAGRVQISHCDCRCAAVRDKKMYKIQLKILAAISGQNWMKCAGSIKIK